MTHTDFATFCKTHTPIKIETDNYGDITITFEDGVIIDVSPDSEYDMSVFSFETNTEKEEKIAAQKRKHEEEANRLLLFNAQKEKLKAKYSTEQWEEIEETFKLREIKRTKFMDDLLGLNKKFYPEMYEKYGYDIIFKDPLNT